VGGFDYLIYLSAASG